MLCTSATLALCGDRFDRGSRQIKREPVGLATMDDDVSLCQRVGGNCGMMIGSTRLIGLYRAGAYCVSEPRDPRHVTGCCGASLKRLASRIAA